MLTTILNNLPVPKFVIIQDSLNLPGHNILFSIVKAHLDLKRYDIHYFCFENSPEKIKTKYISENFHVYDFLTDNLGWVDHNSKNFDKFFENSNIKGVIIIDSLSHFILEYGVAQSYKILSKLKHKQNIIQISSILHLDTLVEKVEVLKYFEYLSTLNLRLELVSNKTRVEYKHKKLGGKLVRKIEEYYFENNILRSKEIEKIDPAKILGSIQTEISPESLSTFKISLHENEKISRDGLTLPYTTKSEQATGSVIYNMDDDDDWDDEDPDDDLDI